MLVARESVLWNYFV